MIPTRKDYFARPPKKRPLALYNYILDTAGEDDENMQPQDLSMKSRRARTPSPPPRPSPQPQPYTLPQPPAPSLTPRRPADVSTLLELVGGGIKIAANITNTTTITNINGGVSSGTSTTTNTFTTTTNTTANNTFTSNNNTFTTNNNTYTNNHNAFIANNAFSTNNNSYVAGNNNYSTSNSSYSTNSSAFSSNSSSSSSFNNSSNSFMSSAGLRLISEVAAACGRPTVLRAPSTTPPSRTMPYAPPTPRDPLRDVLRDRSVGVRSWPYNPYLPLGVYGLPSPLQATQKSIPSPVSSPSVRARSGSVSPPGETGSSSSESSPEVQQESRAPRLACPDCGRRYATVAGLAKHHQFHCLKDAGRSFACNHCDKVYTSLGALKMHIRTHTLPCKCQLCGKAFSRPWLLQGHIRTHTGEKPFQCSQCDRCFADRSNLRAHLQTHTDVKKYACRTCPKTFSRMSLLVKHEDHGCPGMRPTRPLLLAPAPPLPMPL